MIFLLKKSRIWWFLCYKTEVILFCPWYPVSFKITMYTKNRQLWGREGVKKFTVFRKINPPLGRKLIKTIEYWIKTYWVKIKCVQKADFYFLSGHLSKKVCQYLPGDNGREGVSQIMTNGDGVKNIRFCGDVIFEYPPTK